MVPALLKWIGNKQRFAETIISYMPETFNNYYEPFLGSGAVMAELLNMDTTQLFPHFQHAYGSDVLPFLIDIFEIVKETPDVLIKYYKKEITEYYQNPNSKYDEIRNRFNKNHNAHDFCLLSRTCYSGVIRFRKADGYMSTPRGPHNPIKPETFEKRVWKWNELLWQKIAECKERGAKVILSINGMRNSKQTDISITPPTGLFERRLLINCGTSMIDRLQNTGKKMKEKAVDDQLLLTW